MYVRHDAQVRLAILGLLMIASSCGSAPWSFSPNHVVSATARTKHRSQKAAVSSTTCAGRTQTAAHWPER
jgi:hypothetical protein